MKCKTCGVELKEEKMDFVKLPKLNIEVTPMRKYTGKYCDIIIPKGCRMIKLSEAIEILDNYEDYKNILGKDLKEPFSLWCEQLNIDRKNNWSRVLFRDRDLDLYARDVYLAYSNSDGRVIFVRKGK